MNQEKIGFFIKKLRNEKKMTQAELAKKLNVTDRAVSKWERGKGLPDISLLEDLSEIFNVSILEILKGERLESESIKEASILDMLKYAKEDKKNFINKVVNVICLVVIILTGFSLGIKNIKSIYYQNKKYRTDFSTYNYDLKNLKQISLSINQNIELIENNHGKFSLQDYEKILDMVSDISKNINYEEDRKILEKKSFNLKEIEDSAKKQLNLESMPDDVAVLLLKYDSSVYENYKYISILYQEYLDVYNLSNLYNKIYSYTSVDRGAFNSLSTRLSDSIVYKYEIVKLILECVITAGDIHE